MSHNWIILKFGGSSVGEARHWQTIAEQCQQRQSDGLRPILVLSALKNISNLLEALLHQALAGVHPQAIEHLREQHLSFSSQLDLDLCKQFSPWFEQLSSDCDFIHQAGKISPQLHARVLAIGELLSTTIGAAYLKSKGFDSHWLDARELLKCADHQDPWHHFTSASCDYSPNDQLSHHLAQTYASKCSGNDKSVLITQGFIAADNEKNTVLLGREGSDTSATYLGAILSAERVEIWTDVTGVYSSNPKEIPDAQQIARLSYQQANQMAKFGAKVLHPRAVQPAQENNIPLTVRSTWQPEHPGSTIGLQAEKQDQAIAVVYEAEVTRVSFDKELNNSAKQKLITKLKQLGFDPLMQQQLGKQIHLLLVYSNSDQAQADDKKITIQLCQAKQSRHKHSHDNCHVQSGYSLVSVIGSKSKSKWLEKYEQLCTEAIVEKDIVAIYPDKLDGRLCLLTHTAQNLKIARLLHQQLIDPRHLTSDLHQL